MKLVSWTSVLGLVGITAVLTLIDSSPASSQSAGNFVALQPSLPGSQQPGNINVSGTAMFGQVMATVTLSSSPAVFGFNSNASASATGVSGGSSHTHGRGVYGSNSSSSGPAYGVYGWNSSTGGIAILGACDSGALGTGVRGDVQGVSGRAVHGVSRYTGYGASSYGVLGENSAQGGTGVGGFVTAAYDGAGTVGYNYATTANAYGGYFQTSSVAGIAVRGQTSSATGSTTGVWGQTESPAGVGVFGKSNKDTGAGFGVWGETISPDGTGVFGYARQTSGVSIGVLGQCDSPAGYAIYGIGRLATTGTKSFVIDHPLDPENKFLNHYCTEGSEPINSYSGNTVTDRKGYAWISLPEYFAEINRDFRYQLTVVDGDDVQGFIQAKISRKIEDNRFQIRTSAPYVEVSWEVKAVRNDRFVATYGAPVEIAKSDSERGLYIHPNLYGKGKEAGLANRPQKDAPTIRSPKQ